MMLYHASFAKNADSILQNGLRRGCPSNWNGMCMQNMLYLAVNAEAAVSYAEASDTYNGEDIVVFCVDAKDLDPDKIKYDWNNRCEYEDDINSVAYDADIPAKLIKVSTEDDNGTIHKFFGTEFYERIMETFHCENVYAKE